MTLRLLLCFYIAASLFAVYSSRLLGLGAQRALLVLALVLFVLAFIVAFARFSHRLHLPNIIFIFTSMATLCLAVVLSQWRLSTQLDRQLEQRIVARISGQVLGLPVVSADSTRFEFQIEHAQDEQGQAITLPFDHVRVSWRDAQALRMGQRCVLSLRLSRPRGFVNWAGFDYQAWLLAKGVGGGCLCTSRACKPGFLL